MIVAHDDPALLRAINRLAGVLLEPLARLEDGQVVHGRRAGLHGAAKAGGAEGDAGREALRQLGGVGGGDELLDLGAGGGILRLSGQLQSSLW